MKTEKTHPSFVQVSFSRVNSSVGEVFYGSNIKSNSFIELRIMRSKTMIDGHREWHFSEEPIIKLKLSPTQFSELLTTMNCGSGVTGTLEWINQGNLPTGRIPEPPYNNSLDLVEDHIASFEGTLLQDKFTALENSLEETKMSQKDKTALKNRVAILKQELESNLPYYIKVAKEEISKTIDQAKGVIDSFYTGVCTKLGIKALQERKEMNEITFHDEDSETGE